MGKRSRRRQFEKRQREVHDRLVGSFAAWLPTDTLPRPGYYVRTDDRESWRYLDGETEQTQECRTAELTDDTLFALGVYAEGDSGGEVEVRPLLVVLP